MLPQFWPYEEVRFELKDASSGTFSITCPWVESEIEIEAGSENFKTLAAFAAGGIDAIATRPNGPAMLSQILAALESLPIAYRLPRRGRTFGKDSHRLGADLPLATPQSLAKELGVRSPEVFGLEWTWDAEASLELSSLSPTEFDPQTLLTVARRFHYLDCSDNQIGRVYAYVQTLEDVERRDEACALIVRQNHYVTERCEAALEPSKALAQGALRSVEEFIAAERGHDKLLAGSLRAMGRSATDLEPVPAVVALMTLLEATARHSFLAFCMALDFFEKPQFRDQDELGEVLGNAGQGEAAKALQIHKDINDGGEHEAVSSGLLEFMKPVDRGFALQALRLAELVSRSIARVPYDLEKRIRG